MNTTPQIAAQIEAAAELAHEANRAYCLSHGDNSIPPWKEASEEQRASIRVGVTHIVSNRHLTPEQSHENWLETKRRNGWTYGPVKDKDAKTHPRLVSYAELPEQQRVKNTIFGAVVRASLTVSGYFKR